MKIYVPRAEPRIMARVARSHAHRQRRIELEAAGLGTCREPVGDGPCGQPTSNPADLRISRCDHHGGPELVRRLASPKRDKRL